MIEPLVSITYDESLLNFLSQCVTICLNLVKRLVILQRSLNSTNN
jgi:hypothetical protein